PSYASSSSDPYGSSSQHQRRYVMNPAKSRPHTARAPYPVIVSHKVGSGVSVDQAQKAMKDHQRKLVGLAKHLAKEKDRKGSKLTRNE
ncbi:hypothetical protein HK102_011164, partial [Quaeritorhiza haematococci]